VFWNTVPRAFTPSASIETVEASASRLSIVEMTTAIQHHVLRVSCRRCERTVEQTADAVRLFGGNAIWKDVARRLLDDTTTHRQVRSRRVLAGVREVIGGSPRQKSAAGAIARAIRAPISLGHGNPL